MSKTNDGGSAFPAIWENLYEKGMSLRDYFAAHASEDDIKDIQWQYEMKISRHEARYIHADEMIKVRGEGN